MTEQETTTPVSVDAAPASGSSDARSSGPRRGAGPRGAGNRGGSNRRRDSRNSFSDVKPEFDQKTLSVRRVTRVVAGGRRFAFSVVLAIGDRKGRAGVGIGKAGDTAQAIDKAYSVAKKNMLKLRLTNTNSIPHDVTAKYNSARVFLTPNRGRGMVAGSAMRVLLELAGVRDVTGKVLSPTKNKLNIARATQEALRQFAVAK